MEDELREADGLRVTQDGKQVVELEMRRNALGQFEPRGGVEQQRKINRTRSIRELAKPFTQEALVTLLEIMRDREGKAKVRDRLHAAEVILAYAWGRPAQLQWADDSPENPLHGFSTREIQLLLVKAVQTPTIDVTEASDDDDGS